MCLYLKWLIGEISWIPFSIYVRTYVGKTGGPGWSTSSVSDMNNAKHFDAGGELSSGRAISADCGAINCVASS